MSEDSPLDTGLRRQRLQEQYRRLAEARRLRPVTAIVARYTEIEGGTLGAMVSVQLFTTVIPLMIMGFSYMRGFADNASPGTLIIRELGLVHPNVPRTKPPIYGELRWLDELDSADAQGCVVVPDGPGLGVPLDWEWINGHKSGETVFA